MMSNRSRWMVAAGAVLLVLGGALVWWRLEDPSGQGADALGADSSGEAQAASGGGRSARGAQSPQVASYSSGDKLELVPCELDSLLDEYRQGKASPAYRAYVREQLQAILETLPPEVLWSRLEREEDMEVLELVGSLWARRFNFTKDYGVLDRLVRRAESERDPVRRATLVRSLLGTDEPSIELLASNEHLRNTYRKLSKDEAPEVRQAVVNNFTTEAKRSFGRYQGLAEQAVALAAEVEDPKTAVGLLQASSLETVGTPAMATVNKLLESSPSVEVRTAAAKALGTAPPGELNATLEFLSKRFTAEPERAVRSALLESLSRLGLSQATPYLQRLKGKDPTLDGEIDMWLRLLASHPHNWHILHQDKIAQEQRQQGG